MPKGWNRTAGQIRKRDVYACRRCGYAAPDGPIDHLIPRRLLRGPELSNARNLALLCLSCHAEKTQRIEPALYRGNVLAFDLFLENVAHCGPVPSDTLKARAYARLRRLLGPRSRRSA